MPLLPAMPGGGGGDGDRQEPAPDWAPLHVDLTQLIAARVLATGRATAAASPRGRALLNPRFHPRRWMLFPEGFGWLNGHARSSPAKCRASWAAWTTPITSSTDETMMEADLKDRAESSSRA